MRMQSPALSLVHPGTREQHSSQIDAEYVLGLNRGCCPRIWNASIEKVSDVMAPGFNALYNKKSCDIRMAASDTTRNNE